MHSEKLFYLASPFTHKSKYVRSRRINKVTDITIRLLRAGIQAFSPIAYNGAWERSVYRLPCEWPFWEKYDKNFLRRCDAIVVLQLPGWDKSVGVTAEIEYAIQLGMPVFYITEEQVVTEQLGELLDYLCK
jgi:nucleoside 2-deoxyribosyltransferase